MHLRWNSEILPRAETVISCAFPFSGWFESFIKRTSFDNFPKMDETDISYEIIINNIANCKLQIMEQRKY